MVGVGASAYFGAGVRDGVGITKLPVVDAGAVGGTVGVEVGDVRKVGVGTCVVGVGTFVGFGVGIKDGGGETGFPVLGAGKGCDVVGVRVGAVDVGGGTTGARGVGVGDMDWTRVGIGDGA